MQQLVDAGVLQNLRRARKWAQEPTAQMCLLPSLWKVHENRIALTLVWKNTRVKCGVEGVTPETCFADVSSASCNSLLRAISCADVNTIGTLSHYAPCTILMDSCRRSSQYATARAICAR